MTTADNNGRRQGDRLPEFPHGDTVLFTTAEAADFLRCSPQTLANWRTLGIGPLSIKAGKRAVLYAKQDLLDWLNSRRRQSTSEPVPALTAKRTRVRL